MATSTKPVTLPPTLRSSDPDYTRERYSTPQAAQYLGVSENSLYTLMGNGEIGFRRRGAGHGARARFSQADLDAWRARYRIDVDARHGMRAAAKRPSDDAEVERLLPKERYFQ